MFNSLKQNASRILLCVNLILILLLVAGSFYRFIVLQDYVVGFEGDCDPATESCFVDCEDDECTEEYYYSLIERNANDLFALCGEDVTTCDAAYECPLDDLECSITFCDPAVDEECVTEVN